MPSQSLNPPLPPPAASNHRGLAPVNKHCGVEEANPSLPLGKNSFGDLGVVTQPGFAIQGESRTTVSTICCNSSPASPARMIAVHVANRLLCLGAIYFWVPTCNPKLQTLCCSRAVEMALSGGSSSVTLVSHWCHPGPRFLHTEGSPRLLRNDLWEGVRGKLKCFGCDSKFAAEQEWWTGIYQEFINLVRMARDSSPLLPKSAIKPQEDLKGSKAWPPFQ